MLTMQRKLNIVFLDNFFFNFLKINQNIVVKKLLKLFKMLMPGIKYLYIFYTLS